MFDNLNIVKISIFNDSDTSVRANIKAKKTFPIRSMAVFILKLMCFTTEVRKKHFCTFLKTGCYCPLPTRHNVETPENSQAGEVVFASGVWKSNKSAILSTIVGALQVVWTGYTYNISRLVPEACHSLHDTIKRHSCGG